MLPSLRYFIGLITDLLIFDLLKTILNLLNNIGKAKTLAGLHEASAPQFLLGSYSTVKL